MRKKSGIREGTFKLLTRLEKMRVTISPAVLKVDTRREVSRLFTLNIKLGLNPMQQACLVN